MIIIRKDIQSLIFLRVPHCRYRRLKSEHQSKLNDSFLSFYTNACVFPFLSFFFSPPAMRIPHSQCFSVSTDFYLSFEIQCLLCHQTHFSPRQQKFCLAKISRNSINVCGSSASRVEQPCCCWLSPQTVNPTPQGRYAEKDNGVYNWKSKCSGDFPSHWGSLHLAVCL